MTVRPPGCRNRSRFLLHREFHCAWRGLVAARPVNHKRRAPHNLRGTDDERERWPRIHPRSCDGADLALKVSLLRRMRSHVLQRGSEPCWHMYRRSDVIQETCPVGECVSSGAAMRPPTPPIAGKTASTMVCLQRVPAGPKTAIPVRSRGTPPLIGSWTDSPSAPLQSLGRGRDTMANMRANQASPHPPQVRAPAVGARSDDAPACVCRS